MSREALSQFAQAREEQLDRNEARRMRTSVHQARGGTSGAGSRWPFELTQNAHDPGARDGKVGVDIKLEFDGHSVLYEHNGKPFTMQDLAALLSGGSSKEFEASETTGRFGTGFLVTHVLALQISFTGVLEAEGGPEKVSISLDRAGDEQDILTNTRHCHRAIEEALKLTALDGHPTAQFRYQTDNPQAAQLGVTTFCRTLPYLYGTCEHLGIIRLRDDADTSWCFVPELASEQEFRGHHLRVRRFTLTKDNDVPKTFSAIRLRRQQDSSSSLIVVTEQVGGRSHLQVPPDGFPRIFCRFPISASNFLPINAVIDGRFDLGQERDRVLMNDGDKTQIEEALCLLPVLTRLAMNEDWIKGHKLARVGMPNQAFGEKLDEQHGLKPWWRDKLGNTAQTMSQLQIVQTSIGLKKASEATFVVPRFKLEESRDELDFGSVWKVTNELRDLYLPAHSIASDWSSIVSDWADLGAQLHRVGLTEIANAVSHEAKTLEELKVRNEPLLWLAQFLELIGRIAGQHNCAKILTNLLPNQNRALRAPASLSWDKGIKTELKDIALAIGDDLRDRLLLEELAKYCQDATWVNLKNLLTEQVTQELNESGIIEECIRELNKELPDNKPIAPEKLPYGRASVELLKYLWESQGEEAMQVAKECPLIAKDNSAVRWTAQRKALAPVSVWPASARPFAALYENERILSEDYISKAAGTRTLVDALEKWDMAFVDPLCRDAPRDLKGERLKAISVENEDCTNAVVTNVPLSQIAHLPNQLIQRCQNDEDLAKLLLGLTLQHIAVSDPSWREACQLPARQGPADISIKAFPSLWLADLRSKAWVPVRGEKDGQPVVQPVIADAGNLRPLLDPTWLANNDSAVDLLSRFFGFNALELRLLSTVPQETRNQVESNLARIVQTLGDDPDKYGQLVADLAVQQEREAQREKNRKFGLAVQEAVKGHLTRRGLFTELIDRGYDYALSLEDPGPDVGIHHLELANYLLEVKATTTGEVRLTPAQARTASQEPDRFILCVVDLRDVEPERLEGEWTPTDVEPRASIVIGIGSLVGESHDLVEQAKGCNVGIRNDEALRYGVPTVIWKAGLSLAEWIDSLPPLKLK